MLACAGREQEFADPDRAATGLLQVNAGRGGRAIARGNSERRRRSDRGRILDRRVGTTRLNAAASSVSSTAGANPDWVLGPLGVQTLASGQFSCAMGEVTEVTEVDGAR